MAGFGGWSAACRGERGLGGFHDLVPPLERACVLRAENAEGGVEEKLQCVPCRAVNVSQISPSDE